MGIGMVVVYSQGSRCRLVTIQVPVKSYDRQSLGGNRGQDCFENGDFGILISGRGSNMVALVDAVQSGEIPDSEVVVVISDQADAAGLAKAGERGVETV